MGASIEWRCDGSGLLTEAFRLREALIDSGLLRQASKQAGDTSWRKIGAMFQKIEITGSGN